MIHAYFKKAKDIRSFSKIFKPYNTRFIELNLDEFMLKYYLNDKSKKESGSYNLQVHL